MVGGTLARLPCLETVAQLYIRSLEPSEGDPRGLQSGHDQRHGLGRCPGDEIALRLLLDIGDPGVPRRRISIVQVPSAGPLGGTSGMWRCRVVNQKLAAAERIQRSAPAPPKAQKPGLGYRPDRFRPGHRRRRGKRRGPQGCTKLLGHGYVLAPGYRLGKALTKGVERVREVRLAPEDPLRAHDGGD